MEPKRTQLWTFQIAVVIAGLLLPSTAAGQKDTPTRIDLARALEQARRNSPVLQVAHHSIAEAKGDLTGASLLLVNNPAIGIGAGQRRSTTPVSETSLDFELELAQRFEIGGQRGHRVDLANAQLRASQATAKDVHRVVELAVTLAFFDALAAQGRFDFREEGQKLAEGLFVAATKRLERGAGTPLEVNTARIRRAEAKRRRTAARAASRSTLLRVQQLLGLPTDRAIKLEGRLPNAQLNQAENALVTQALKHRPDLRAAEQRVEAAQAAVELADSKAWPDVSLGVSYGEEEGDRVLLGGIRFSIPLFNRNQGQRRRYRATVSRLRAEKNTRQVAVESEVRRAYTDYAQARNALSLYDAEVIQAQKESLALLQRAFEAGEVGYADVIVVQREVLEGREGLLNVRLEFARARAALLASAGIPQFAKKKGKAP